MRILIVEDVDDLAEAARIFLELEGHTVTSARNALEGLHLAEEFRPNVVLMDLAMPDVSGYDLLRALRRDPGFDGTWIIAVTGYPEITERVKTEKAGFDFFVPKPIDYDALVARIESLGSRSGSAILTN